MSHHLGPRFDFAPLERTARRYRPNVALSEALNISSITIAQMRHRGLSWQQADRLAVCELKIHPSAIWPQWWDVIVQAEVS